MRKFAEVVYLCPSRADLREASHCTLLEYFEFELSSILYAYKYEDAEGVQYWKRRAKETRAVFRALLQK